jgi:hypothetical protein
MCRVRRRGDMSSLITTTIIIIVIIIITCTLPLNKPQVTRDEVCQGAQQQWKTTFVCSNAEVGSGIDCG